MPTQQMFLRSYGGVVRGPHDGDRAIAGGGYTNAYNADMGSKTISTLGNFSYFGQLGDAKYGLNAASGGNVGGDASRALFMGGGDTRTDNINYVTVATASNSSYFGDLLEAMSADWQMRMASKWLNNGLAEQSRAKTQKKVITEVQKKKKSIKKK